MTSAEAADKIPDMPTSETASEALTNGQTDDEQQMFCTAIKTAELTVKRATEKLLPQFHYALGRVSFQY